jgi:hypothetical protein
MYVSIHTKSHFRPILDKIDIRRQSTVKIINVRQHFQDSRRNSTCSIQKNRQADGHHKTNSRFSHLLPKAHKNERLNQNTENFEF